MVTLTSHEALQLTATFAMIANRMRNAGTDTRNLANLYETASRVAFMRAYRIATDEKVRSEVCSEIRETPRRVVFAMA